MPQAMPASPSVCVHNDYGMPEQIQFWSVADNVRFGGALMAVKIAEKLIEEYLY